MTSISHALIGAALANRIADPATCAVVAVLTHFACDAIPHWDLGTNWRLRPKAVTGILAITETCVALAGTYLLFFRLIPNTLLFIAIIASLIPDWIEAPYHIMTPRAPKLFYYFYKIQSLIHSRAQAPLGIWTQLITVAAFLLWGFK